MVTEALKLAKQGGEGYVQAIKDSSVTAFAGEADRCRLCSSFNKPVRAIIGGLAASETVSHLPLSRVIVGLSPIPDLIGPLHVHSGNAPQSQGTTTCPS